jgi:hypothetical protein
MHAARGLFPAQVTSTNSFAAGLNDFVDIDHPTEPEMPRIKHLWRFGHMGFAALACTTRFGLICHWIKDAPDFRHAQSVGNIAAMPVLGGLHHQYVRV